MAWLKARKIEEWCKYCGKPIVKCVFEQKDINNLSQQLFCLKIAKTKTQSRLQMRKPQALVFSPVWPFQFVFSPPCSEPAKY